MIVLKWFVTHKKLLVLSHDVIFDFLKHEQFVSAQIVLSFETYCLSSLVPPFFPYVPI